MPPSGTTVKNAAKAAAPAIKSELASLEKAVLNPSAVTKAGVEVEKAIAAKAGRAGLEKLAAGAPAMRVDNVKTATASVPALDINAKNAEMFRANNGTLAHPAAQQAALGGKGPAEILKNPTLVMLLGGGAFGVASKITEFVGMGLSKALHVPGWQATSAMGDGIASGATTVARHADTAGAVFMAPLRMIGKAYTSKVSDLPNVASEGLRSVQHSFTKNGQPYTTSAGFISDNVGKAAEATSKAESVVMPEFGKMAGEASSKLGNAADWVGGKLNINETHTASISGKLRDMPQTFQQGVGQWSTGKALAVGGVVTSSVIQKKNMAQQMGKRFEALNDMYAELKGIDPESVSPMALLFAKDMPPMLTKVRNNFLQDIPAATLMTIGSDVFSAKLLDGYDKGRGGQATGGYGSLTTILGLALLQGVSSTMIGNMIKMDPILDSYASMKEAYDTVGFMPKNLVVTALTELSPTLRPKGEVDEAIQTIALEYSQNGTTPSQFMNDIVSGAAAAKYQQVAAELRKQAAPDTPDIGAINNAMTEGRVQEPVLAKAGV